MDRIMTQFAAGLIANRLKFMEIHWNEFVLRIIAGQQLNGS
jgi:hypothetical protein